MNRNPIARDNQDSDMRRITNPLCAILILVAPLQANAQTSPIVSVERIDDIGSPIITSGGIRARISADARYVAYQNSNDTNTPSRIYRHDRMTGTTTVVSVSSTGEEADTNALGNGLEDLSADGRYVVFHSEAGNLVPGDTNGFIDTFVHDTVTGETIRASISSAGAEANGQDFGSNEARISADGRIVTFVSIASNLDVNDANGPEDIFVHDLQSRETTLVSISSTGVQSNGQAHGPSISSDGNIVAFAAEATTLGGTVQTFNWPMYVHDRTTAATTLISRADNGSAAGVNVGADAALSDDGRFVGFKSWQNIEGVNPDRNNVDGNAPWDSYVHDRVTQTTVRVNPSSDGSLADRECGGNPFILTAGGRYAAYSCGATNLVAGDTNDMTDVFVFDLTTGVNKRVSVTVGGSELTDHHTNLVDMTPDGRFLLVKSSIRNFDPTEPSDNLALFLLETNLPPDAQNPAADTPVAMDDGASVDSGATVSINVLANDSGLADAPIVVSISINPRDGSAQVLADNRISYTADSNFFGNDSFEYTITDTDGETSSAVVTLNITTPVVVNPDVDAPKPRKGGGGAVSPLLLLLILSACVRIHTNRCKPGPAKRA